MAEAEYKQQGSGDYDRLREDEERVSDGSEGHEEEAHDEAPEAVQPEMMYRQLHDAFDGGREEDEHKNVVLKQPTTEDGEPVKTSCAGNCVVSVLLAAYLCKRRCRVSEVAAEFAYFPPTPSTYRFIYGADGKIAKLAYNVPELEHDPSHALFAEDLSALGVTPFVVSSSSLQMTSTALWVQLDTCMFYFEHEAPPEEEDDLREINFNFNKQRSVHNLARRRRSTAGEDNPKLSAGQPRTDQLSVRRSRRIIIFAHGNATDCGVQLGFLKKMSDVVEVSVLALDYSGYGESTGFPTPSNCVHNVSVAYDKALELGYSPSDIVLMGVSVGTCAVCEVAADKEVAGLILISPMAAGLLAVSSDGRCSPFSLFSWFDPFNNLALLRSIQAKVWVVHGTDDQHVPIWHGRRILDAAANTHPPYWVPNAMHSNTISQDESELFMRMQNFLSALDPQNRRGSRASFALPTSSQPLRSADIVQSRAPSAEL